MPLNGNTPSNSSSDNSRADSDVHGKAALLLAESLVHGLCENMILSANQAVEIADRAVSVQHELATLSEDSDGSPWRSHALLIQIANSLRTDLGDGPLHPRLVP